MGDPMAIAASRFETLALEGVGRSFPATTTPWPASTSPSGAASSSRCSGRRAAASRPRSTASPACWRSRPAASWLDGRRIDPLRPEERGFGMVFQNYALFPHLSVRQNVGFGLKMRGVGREADPPGASRRRSALVRLGGQAEKLPGQLSGGQQQRVAIARAVVIEPPLVLMDEPLSNLDAKLRLEMRAEIRRIHNTLGATTIYVTHDQDEALSLADRIVVMRDGVVRQVGTPDELYDTPAACRRRRVHGLPQRRCRHAGAPAAAAAQTRHQRRRGSDRPRPRARWRTASAGRWRCPARRSRRWPRSAGGLAGRGGDHGISRARLLSVRPARAGGTDAVVPLGGDAAEVGAAIASRCADPEPRSWSFRRTRGRE